MPGIGGTGRTRPHEFVFFRMAGERGGRYLAPQRCRSRSVPRPPMDSTRAGTLRSPEAGLPASDRDEVLYGYRISARRRIRQIWRRPGQPSRASRPPEPPVNGRSRMTTTKGKKAHALVDSRPTPVIGHQSQACAFRRRPSHNLPAAGQPRSDRALLPRRRGQSQWRIPAPTSTT